MMEGIFKLQEEMGELNQVLGKIGQAGSFDHWKGNIKQNLLDEMADVFAALYFIAEVNFDKTETQYINKRAVEKMELFRQWHHECTMKGI